MNHISHRASSVNSPKSSQISLHNSKSDHILNFTKTNFTAKTDKASTRLALFSSSKRNAGYAKPDLFEKAAVASLEVWENSLKGNDNLASLKDAQESLKRRLSHSDVVEQHLSLRKSKETTNNSQVNHLSIDSLQETTKLRQSKKIEEEQFKERCRYYRSYEEDLVVAYEKIEDELKVCNQTKESYRRDCSEMREEMTNVLKELENWKKETADTEKKEKLKLRRRQVEMASFLSKKQSLREDLNRRDAETALIVESITNEINKRHNHLKVLDEESANLRKKLTQIKNAQIKHYLDLLKEGKDTRSEGLLWIIKELWKLNHKVTINDFPTYLDENLVNFLLAQAEKSREIDDLLENLVNSTSRRTSFKQASSVDRWNNLKTRIAKIAQNIRVKRPEYKFDKKNKTVNITWQAVEGGLSNMRSINSTNSNFGEVLVLEQHISSLKDRITKEQEKEIKRITHECSINNYEGRFRTSLKDLLSAIIGVESVDKYMVLVIKEQRDIVSRMENTKTFTFSTK